MSDLMRLAALVQAEHQGKLPPEQKAVLAELRSRAHRKNQTLAQYIEPVLSIGSSAIAEPVSGFVGLAGLPFGTDAAANAVRKTQDAMTFTPQSEGGKKGIRKVGGFMQKIMDEVNPIAKGTVSSLYGAIPGITLEEQRRVHEMLPGEGMGGDLGALAEDLTGSPALATLASLYPTIAAELMGLKGAGKMPGKQLEVKDIGGQRFGQRGAVSGVSDPDLEYYYHTSGEEIGEITPEGGRFGSNMFFASEPYFMGYSDTPRVYKTGFNPNEIIDATSIPFREWSDVQRADYKRAVQNVANMLDTDDLDLADDLLTERASLFDHIEDLGIDPEDAGEMEWDLQRELGDLGKDLGFKAVRGTDEQGEVLIAPMFGREKELIDVTKEFEN